jgi:hypothetical protein
MAFTSLCPHCGWTPRFGDHMEGSQVICPECSEFFVARTVSIQDRALPHWMRLLFHIFTLGMFAIYTSPQDDTAESDAPPPRDGS